MTADDVIRQLHMKPPEMEGGHCTELYRCTAQPCDGTHAAGFSSYYLIKAPDVPAGTD